MRSTVLRAFECTCNACALEARHQEEIARISLLSFHFTFLGTQYRLDSEPVLPAGLEPLRVGGGLLSAGALLFGCMEVRSPSLRPTPLTPSGARHREKGGTRDLLITPEQRFGVH